MKAKKTGLEISDDLVESMMWMAIRYSVGGHTIATCTLAADITKFLRDNPSFLSKKRGEFTARDINAEISTVMGYKDNVSSTGFQTRRNALTLILDHCIKTGIKPSEWGKHKYAVDFEKGICESEPYPDSRVNYYLIDIEDLMPWVKLSGWLLPNETIVIKDGQGGTVEKSGFRYYDVDRKNDEFVVRHITCEGYERNLRWDTFLSPEYIVEIKKIY